MRAYPAGFGVRQVEISPRVDLQVIEPSERLNEEVVD